MLKFDNHLTEIGKKTSKQLAVLKRLGRFLTKQEKLVIYNSFISSNFSYCPLAWHFCSIASTNKLEKVQERALGFINNDYSSSLRKLLSQTKTEPLHVKRLNLMACEVFKIINKLSPEYIHDMISVKTSTNIFRGERKADIPRVNTSRYGLRLPGSGTVFLTTCGRQSHTRSSEGCSGDGTALDVDALCIVPNFVFFCFLAYVLPCFALLYLLHFAVFAFDFAFHNKFYPLSHPFVHLCLRNFRFQDYLME